jgi:Rieske Fe-S protein
MEPRNASVPLFADTAPPVAVPSLASEPKQGLSADVVVIGAGIAGLTTAYPHLGCIVAWNSFERGWDCPCHGSLYAADGTVLNGPSPVSLKE